MASTELTSGCLECKAEYEERDESRPYCLRCQQSRIECPRYAYIEDPDKINTKSRTIPAPRTLVVPSQVLAHKETQWANNEELDRDIATCEASHNVLDAFGVASAGTWLEAMDISDELASSSSSSSSLQHSSICSASNRLTIDDKTPEAVSTSLSISAGKSVTSLPVGPLEGLFNLTQGSNLELKQRSQPTTRSSELSVSYWSPPGTGRRGVSDEDSESTVSVIRRELLLDRTVKSNALPFVLQAYVAWMNRVAFDPLKLASNIREFVHSRFEDDNQSRWTIALLANIGSRIGSEEFVEGKHHPMLAALQTTTRRRLGAINSCASPKRSALAKALQFTIEAMVIHFFASPASEALILRQEAAPIFRQLCPEPPGEPINLHLLVQNPLDSLWHFAYMDIVFGIITDTPTLYRYEVNFPGSQPSYSYRPVSSIQSDGVIQWTRGIPNPLVLVFAHMQSMRQDGLTLDGETVMLLERQIRELPPFNGSSSDRFLAIMRSVVQECWRQAAFVYLYMAMCGDPSDTPRVQDAFKRYMRLLNGTKPGRLPDEFLILTLQIVYPAAQKPRDREVIKQRVYSRDRTRSATAFILFTMNEVWRRADAEGRPIIWSDVVASRKAMVIRQLAQQPGRGA